MSNVVVYCCWRGSGKKRNEQFNNMFCKLTKVGLVIFEFGIIKSPRSWGKNRGAPETSTIESAKTMLVVMGVVLPRMEEIQPSSLEKQCLLEEQTMVCFHYFS